MKIIADSGSTKTHWLVTTNSGQRSHYHTSGINPSLMDEEHIRHIISDELMPRLATIWWVGPIESVEFYGAGCAGEEPLGRMRDVLAEFFKHARITVDSDMLGACKALLGAKSGVCAILGTGSNTCYYDGEKIAHSVPSLGFILGDEGGGAYLGKRLVADMLKGLMPEDISQAFRDKYQLTVADVVKHVYREPKPNKYLAQYTYFIAEHIDNAAIRTLVDDSFDAFIRRNILAYHLPALTPIHCVGSIAYVFREQLRQAIEKHDLTLGNLLKEPLQ